MLAPASISISSCTGPFYLQTRVGQDPSSNPLRPALQSSEEDTRHASQPRRRGGRTVCLLGGEGIGGRRALRWHPILAFPKGRSPGVWLAEAFCLVVVWAEGVEKESPRYVQDAL